MTSKQQRIFYFIKRYLASNQQAPTMAEIGQHFDMRSSGSVHAVLGKLEREGLITRTANISRGIVIVEREQEFNAS